MGWFAPLIVVSAICPGQIPGNPAYKIASELEASLSVAFNVFPPSLSLAVSSRFCWRHELFGCLPYTIHLDCSALELFPGW
jgi:predicted aminopeptidase